MIKTKKYFIKQEIGKAGLWRNTRPLLGHLDIELTERCNNNCIHCCINLPADDVKAKQKEFSTQEIKKVLIEAVSLGCMTVRFTGGEPFLREDFEELYIFARRSGLRVMVFTNATRITPHLAELFRLIPALEKIEVTVYGMKRSSYEAVTRVSGSFEAFKQGVNLLLEKKVPFVIKGVVLPQNKDELDEFEKWAAAIPGMTWPPRYSMFFDLRCRHEEGKNKLIKSLRLSPQEGVAILIRQKNKYVKDMQEFCSKFMRPPEDELFSCGAGCGGCVDAYGYFQPCMMLRHPDCVYDLKDGSLKDALNNFFPKIRAMRTDNPAYLARCARCFLKGLCEQCPAKSWMEHGELDTPVEYCCDVAHAQARFLGLVGENEPAWEIAKWRERIENFLAK